MKLRNKKTGEIIDIYKGEITLHYNQGRKTIHFKRLEDLEKWEDYEEPKGYYYVATTGLTKYDDTPFCAIHKDRKEIGNYFETKEEAEKAAEKLKAWKRLKDRNLRFNLNYSTGGATINHKDVIMCRIEAYFDDKWEEENMKAEEDLDLLLGGEE